jgi:hypothetical protein
MQVDVTGLRWLLVASQSISEPMRTRRSPFSTNTADHYSFPVLPTKVAACSLAFRFWVSPLCALASSNGHASWS